MSELYVKMSRLVYEYDLLSNNICLTAKNTTVVLLTPRRLAGIFY